MDKVVVDWVFIKTQILKGTPRSNHVTIPAPHRDATPAIIGLALE
jgi:hypothetical protein